MSYKQINQVLDHSKTSGMARLLLLVIATRTDVDGITFIGQERFGKRCSNDSEKRPPFAQRDTCQRSLKTSH
jgi:hypothetical protein